MTTVFSKLKIGLTAAAFGVAMVAPSLAITANAGPGSDARMAVTGPSSSLNSRMNSPLPYVNTSHNYKQGVQHFNAKSYDKSYMSFSRVLHHKPHDANANFYMARVHAVRGNHERAIGHYRKSMRTYGESPVLLAGLGTSYANMNDRDRAKIVLGKLEAASLACDNTCAMAPRIAASLHVVAMAMYPATELKPEFLPTH